MFCVPKMACKKALKFARFGDDTMSFLFEIGRGTRADAPGQTMAHSSCQASREAAAQPRSMPGGIDGRAHQDVADGLNRCAGQPEGAVRGGIARLRDRRVERIRARGEARHQPHRRDLGRAGGIAGLE